MNRSAQEPRSGPTATGFHHAFGSARGPSRNNLFRELAAAQERLARQDQIIVEFEQRLEREADLRARAEASIARSRAIAGRARHSEYISAYRLQMVCYAVLYQLPGDQLTDWTMRWASLDARELQGDFSPRRPYLPDQIVRDGEHGFFIALSPLSPSRALPHQDRRHWRAASITLQPGPPRDADVPADDWRFGLAIPGRLDSFSKHDLEATVAEARVAAKSEWAVELREAQLRYPCPANAYLTASQWLADMPGFRAAVNEMRKRRRAQQRQSRL